MRNRISQLLLGALVLAAATGVATAQQSQPPQSQPPQSQAGSPGKPNILVIWGDDIGISNISAYNWADGLPHAEHRPHRPRRARSSPTPRPAELHRRAGLVHPRPASVPHRAAHHRHAGLPHGIPEWTPTIADLLKDQGYATGQFGKNHLGDQDQHLPTKHGFDEFFGNLYHLNAEEEPESYYYRRTPSSARSSARAASSIPPPMARSRIPAR